MLGPWRSFTFTFALTAAVLLGAGVALGVAADPYGLFWPDRQSHRAGIWWKPRLALPLVLQLRKPEVVVLGSSRVRDGFDPAIFGSKEAMAFGVSGVLIEETAAYAKMIAATKPETVIVGFDLFSFNKNVRYRVDFDPKLDQPIHIAGKLIQGLISGTALDMAWKSFTETELVLPSGFHKRPPAADIIASVKASTDGFHAAPDLYGEIEGYEVRMAAARDTLRALRASGANVIAYISPEHADMHRRFTERGIGHIPQKWAASLAEIAREEGITLWDFSGINSVTSPGPENLGRYYVDGSHFTPIVACMMAARMTVAECGASPPADFGVRR